MNYGILGIPQGMPVEGVICKATSGAAQSISNGGTTYVNFTVTNFDTAGGMHSPTNNPSRITAVRAGYYLVVGMYGFAANGTGPRSADFYINRSGVAMYSTTPASANHGSEMTASSIVFLNEGDYVEMMLSQTCGGSLNSSASCTLCLWKIG